LGHAQDGGVSRWVDGADFVIGGLVPRSSDYHEDGPCESCMGGEGKLTKRCKQHLLMQQRYRCQELRSKGVLSLAPSY